MINYYIQVRDSDGNLVGEFDKFKNLVFGKRLNNYGSCSFDIPVDDPKASDLISLRKNTIWIYREIVTDFAYLLTEDGNFLLLEDGGKIILDQSGPVRTLVWAGEQASISGELNEDGNNWATLYCYDWFEQLRARYTVFEEIYDQVDAGEIAWDLIDASQTSDSFSVEKHLGNPVYTEADNVKDPNLIKIGGYYYCGYTWNHDGDDWEIGIMKSADLINWTKLYTIIPTGDEIFIFSPCFFEEDGTIYMFYTETHGPDWNWIIKEMHTSNIENPDGWSARTTILEESGSGWDGHNVYDPEVIKVDSTYYLFYVGQPIPGGASVRKLGYATSPTIGGPYTKSLSNPVLEWGDEGTENPFLFLWNERYYLITTIVGDPEGTYGDRLKLFRASNFPDEWVDLGDVLVPTFSGNGSWDDYYTSGISGIVEGDTIKCLYQGWNLTNDVWKLGKIDISLSRKSSSDFGIIRGEIEATTNRDRTYYNQNIMEAIINLANVASGFDFEITNDKVFNVYSIKGEDKTGDVVLEYGHNIKNVRISEDFTNPVNRAIVLGEVIGEETLQRIERDDAGLQAENKLREGLFNEMDVSETSTLEDKGDAAIRKYGSSLIQVDFDLIGNFVPSVDEFEVGDGITLIVKEGRYNIDEQYRVFEWTIEYGDNNAERLNLVLGKFITI
jgi:hypothetical protein